MKDNLFYVYEWYNIETGEIFYVGKGTRNRANQTKKRNNKFKNYISNNKCANRIIKTFSDEEEALKYENERILFLKNNNECKCNLDDGGKGGLNFVWNEEMRKYMSEYNPMKNEIQRQRMKNSNPMKNKNISQKVAKKKQKAVIIEGMYFESVKSAGAFYGLKSTEIINWCKRGYDRNKKPCRYANQEQKIFKLKTTCSKEVVIDDKMFNSVKSASEYLGVWSETIIRAIKQNRKCKGHMVRYGNQQPSINLNGL